MDKGIIVDLDGTLANVEHRVHFVSKRPKDWASFNAAMELDTLNRWCMEIVTSMAAKGYKIILITGRSEQYRRTTEDWLQKHAVPWNQLHMRPRETGRAQQADALVKRRIYEEHLQESCSILFVLEDRLPVVRMWREIGLVCLQCAWGDF